MQHVNNAAAPMLDQASAHHRARRFAEAEALYCAVLEVHPGHAGALYGLGLLAMQGGDAPGAARRLEAALAGAVEDERARVHAALAAAYRRLNDPMRALEQYRCVAALQPGSAVAALNLGAALGDVGEFEAAAEAFARALALDPSLVEAREGLAAVLNRLGRHAEAERVCREAAAVTLGLARSLAIALKEQGRLDEAAAALQAVLRSAPADADARYNLAGVLKDLGRTDEALAGFREVLRLQPGHAAARLALCMAHLPPLYRDEAELQARRAAYAAELRALTKWAAQAPADALADGVGAAQPFYLAYQGEDDIALQRLYGGLVVRAMAARYPQVALAPPPKPGELEGGERVRVGIVSGYFRDHSNWRIPVRGWVEGIDRSRFELFGYHTSPLRDDETARIAGRFDRFVQGPRSTEAWREAIARDRPHVLIYPEVGMDPAAVRLAAQRLAPVQCNSWGHPITSGFATLDHFLSSDDMEPVGAEASYGERLVRLPGLSTPLRLDPVAGRPVEAAPRGAGVTFWCGQSLFKYLPRHDEVFARIAKDAGACRFVFIEFPGSAEMTRLFGQRLQAAFARHGLQAERYCQMLPRLAPDRYLAEMGRADVVLDSLGWSGCNSVIDALRCGLPVVTLEGEHMRGRHGAALLRRAGQADRVCATVDDYVALAARLARTSELRRRQPAAAVAEMLARFDDPAGVRALEAFLLEAVRALRTA
jgi:protein O-GlcNAc transferase